MIDVGQNFEIHAYGVLAAFHYIHFLILYHHAHEPVGIMMNSNSLIMDSSSNGQGLSPAFEASRKAQLHGLLKRKMERREKAADRRKCYLRKLPTELIKMTMHYMDEKSLKSFVQTHRSGHSIWRESTRAIFLGMLETQLSDVSKVFGDPSGASVEQRQAMEDALYTCGRYSAHSSKVDSMEGEWWEHLASLRILQENLDLQIAYLHHWPKVESSDTALSREAGRLIWRTSFGSKRVDAAQLVEERVRTFLKQPTEVQDQALEVLQALCKSVDCELGLTVNFGAWATEAHRVKTEGSDEEWVLVQRLSERIIAATLKLSLQFGIQGCSMLLEEPKSADLIEHLENSRIDMLEMLDVEEAHGACAWFELALRLSQAIGLENLMLAYTKSLLYNCMMSEKEQ